MAQKVISKYIGTILRDNIFRPHRPHAVLDASLADRREEHLLSCPKSLSLCLTCDSVTLPPMLVCRPSVTVDGYLLLTAGCKTSHWLDTATLFTTRCTVVQSAVLRSHVVCLSVCNVGGS